MSAWNFRTTQQTLGGAATRIRNAEPKCVRVTLKNTDAANNGAIGFDNTVTALNGFLLTPGSTGQAGSMITLEGAAAHGEIWAIAAAGAPVLCILEEMA